MKVYIAGPMRGIQYYNFPAFYAAQDRLLSRGHTVINPADLDLEAGFNPYELPADTDWDTTPPSFDMEASMRRDIEGVLQAEAIYMLNGWERSKGALAEFTLAQWRGLHIMVEEHDIGDEPTSVERCDEVRLTDPETGGQKGSKLARFSLIPWAWVRALAEHYGRGARKYADRNWERGYAWHLSYDALCRHLAAWWGREDIDQETGSNHMIAVAWYAAALWWFQKHGKGTDTRPGGTP